MKIEKALVAAEWIVAAALSLTALILFWRITANFFAALPGAIAIGIAALLLYKNSGKSRNTLLVIAAIGILWATVGQAALSNQFPLTSTALSKRQVMADIQAAQTVSPQGLAAKKETYDFVQRLDDQAASQVNADLQKFLKDHPGGNYTASDITVLQQALMQDTGNIAAAHALAAAVIYGSAPPTKTTTPLKKVEGLLQWPTILWVEAALFFSLWGVGQLLGKNNLRRAAWGLCLALAVVATLSGVSNHSINLHIPTVAAAAPSHTATITLPADGSPSATFSVKLNVPTAWYYQINAPCGAQAHWSDGTTSSFWDLSQHVGQSFSLSLQGGGTATITWQPSLFPPTSESNTCGGGG